MDRSGLRHELKELIVSALNLEGKSAADIDEAAPLFGVGLGVGLGEGLGLDSLDALELAMAVEERYGVRLPDGDEARPVFASVSSLAEYIGNASADAGGGEGGSGARRAAGTGPKAH